MDARTLEKSLTRYAKGAAFVTQKQVAGFMGVSRDTARRQLRGLESIGGKYYFIPEVISALLESRW